MTNNKLLILERSSSVLEANGIGEDKYVLEGVFSEIGKKNRNNRIYDEKELIPHINKLQEKIKSGKLLGELDHPKQFDISLKNVSHVIEEINYDKQNKVVRGKIRLLDTYAGQQAKALVDGGIPIHISSRAAGAVESNGHVKIKQLFTYDLVADPGFENAELNRVNEQFGFGDEDDIQIYELGGYIKENNTKTEKELYKMRKNSRNNENYVSIEDLNEYSKIIKRQVDVLESKISRSNKPSDNSELIRYTESIAKRVNQIGDYMQMLSENVDNLISHNDYIIENLTKVKDYSEYIGSKTDQSIEYANHIAESANKRFKYQDYVNEHTDQLIDYSNHISESVNRRVEYQDYVNEQTDKIIDYTNYVMESVDSVATYTDYLKENLENFGNYQDYMTKTLNGEEYFNTDRNEYKRSNRRSVNNLNNKVSALVESARKQKVEETSMNTHFLNFLDESKRHEFKMFDSDTKAKVIRKFQNNTWFGTSGAEKLWESVFTEPIKTLDWLENMPRKYKSLWNSLNESQKSTIKAQASVRNLDTQYKIDHFWSTRDLRAYNPSEQIDESRRLYENNSSKYRTPNAYMDTVAEGLKKRFNR